MDTSILWGIYWVIIFALVIVCISLVCESNEDHFSSKTRLDDYGNLPEDKLYIVYTIGNSPYQEWQADLLDFSVKYSKQPGTIIRIVAEDSVHATGKKRKVSQSVHGYTFTSPDFSEVKKGVIQHFMNKSASIDYWLKRLPKKFKENNRNAVCIFLDPDMIFTKKWIPNVPSKSIVGQQWVGYSYEYCVKTSEKSDLCPRKMEEGYMFPYAIHLEDMDLISRDIKEYAFRGYVKDDSKWMLEMTSFVNGAYKNGLRLITRPNVGLCNNWKNNNDPDAPIMHYCQIIKSKGKEVWGKRRYNMEYDPDKKKFENVPDPSLAENRVDFEVLSMIRRYIDFLNQK